MPAPAIHRVTTLDLPVQPWPWPFAEQRRADIAAHFAIQLREKPKMWNGRVLLGRAPVFAGEVFSASYFETDFASFLAWRDWGFPDKDVFNGFGMGALRCADGAFVLDLVTPRLEPSDPINEEKGQRQYFIYGGLGERIEA